MASGSGLGAAGSSNSQHAQLPGTVRPLQTLTQSFAARQRPPTGGLGLGTYEYTSPFASTLSSASIAQQYKLAQRFVPPPAGNNNTVAANTGVVGAAMSGSNAPTTVGGSGSPSFAPSTADTPNILPDAAAPPDSDLDDESSAGGASTSTSAAVGTGAADKRKRGRPKGSKSKQRGGTKGSSLDQPQQDARTQSPLIHTSESLAHPQSNQPQSNAVRVKEEPTTAPGDVDLDEQILPFLLPDMKPTPDQPPPHLYHSPQTSTNTTHSPNTNVAASNSNSTSYSHSPPIPTPKDHMTPRTGSTATPPTHHTLDRSHGSADDREAMLPVYQFYWNAMTLCSDFFQAATDLLVSSICCLVSSFLGDSSSVGTAWRIPPLLPRHALACRFISIYALPRLSSSLPRARS